MIRGCLVYIESDLNSLDDRVRNAYRHGFASVSRRWAGILERETANRQRRELQRAEEERERLAQMRVRVKARVRAIWEGLGEGVREGVREAVRQRDQAEAERDANLKREGTIVVHPESKFTVVKREGTIVFTPDALAPPVEQEGGATVKRERTSIEPQERSIEPQERSSIKRERSSSLSVGGERIKREKLKGRDVIDLTEE